MSIFSGLKTRLFPPAPLTSEQFVQRGLAEAERAIAEKDMLTEKCAKVGDALRGGISWRCLRAVNSLPRKGYATCQRLPSPSCLIHPDFPRTP